MFPFWPATGVWLVLLAAAVTNGALREKFLTPRVGEPTAHIIGTLTGCALIFLITYAFVRHLGPGYSPRAMLAMGAYWLALVLAFEFLFFHYVMGVPWAKLLADYNIAAGRVWILVLLTTLLSPLICRYLL